MPHLIMSYATPQWATLHPNEQRHTLTSYATPQWAKPHPNDPRPTQMSNATLHDELRASHPDWRRHTPMSINTIEQRHTP